MAYSQEQKQKILAKYEQLTSSGTRVLDAAKACGVPYFTISRWMQAAGKPSKAEASKTRTTAKRGGKKRSAAPKRARPAAAAAAPSRYVVTTPSGYRIEADSAKDMAELLNLIM